MSGVLQGKVAVVTGSSSGIGRAIVERLARDGAAVVVNYARGADKAEQVVKGIAAGGGKAVALQADISNVGDVRRLFQQAQDQWGRLDIMVANAGFAAYKPLVEASEEDFDRTFALNTKGTFFCLQEAAKRIADGGRIVCISSSATRMAAATSSFYSGSKAAVEQFVGSLAKEVGQRGITANVVSPGFTDTEMLASVGEQFREVGAKMSPFGRLGKPDDVADVVAFVVSEQARWITGQNIQASGGVA